MMLQLAQRTSDLRRGPRHTAKPLALPGDTVKLGNTELTGQQVEDAILGYLRRSPGKLLREWQVLNLLCTNRDRQTRRKERQFYLAQLRRLVLEKKVIHYDSGMDRHKIRISEAYV